MKKIQTKLLMGFLSIIGLFSIGMLIIGLFQSNIREAKRGKGCFARTIYIYGIKGGNAREKYKLT